MTGMSIKKPEDQKDQLNSILKLIHNMQMRMDEVGRRWIIYNYIYICI